MECIHCNTGVLTMKCDRCKRPICYDCAKCSSDNQPICADCKMKEGRVNPMFWEMRAKYELMMLILLVTSCKSAVVDPMTGRMKAQLPMNINLN